MRAMDHPIETEARAGHLPNCYKCGRTLRQGRHFTFRHAQDSEVRDSETSLTQVSKCIFCAIRHGPMLRRSLAVAAVVGTILTILNQGDTIFAADWKNALYWKIPLTFCVPFCVATYGALASGRRLGRPNQLPAARLVASITTLEASPDLTG